MKDKRWRWFVDRLPKKLIYFAAVHLGASATCGKYGDTEVSTLAFIEALKRWEKDWNI